jgi:hypothetical protein
MLSYALVWEGFTLPESTPIIWLMKMAPRRWFAAAHPETVAVSVTSAASSIGKIDFTIATESADAADIRGSSSTNNTRLDTTTRIHVTVAVWKLLRTGIVKLRLRDPTDASRVLTAVVPDHTGPSACTQTTFSIDAANQTVDIAASDKVGPLLNCSFVATLAAPQN